MISKDLLRISNNLKLIGFSVFFSTLSLILNIAIMYFISKLIISFDSTYIIYIFLLLILKIVSNYASKHFSFKASVFIKPLLRKKIINKAYDLSVNNMDKVDPSKLSQLASDGVEQLEMYYSRYLPQLFYSLIAPIIISIVIFKINYKIALVLLICTPLIPLLIMFIQKMTKKVLDRHWGNYVSLGKRFYDLLLGINILKKYNIAKTKEEYIEKEAEEFRKSTMKVLMMQLNSIILMDFIAFGGAAIGLYFAYSQYTISKITEFELIFIMLLVADYFIPLRLLGSYFHIAMNGVAASDRILKFLSIDIKEQLVNKEFKKGNIITKNLNYSVNGKQILKDINLEFLDNNMYSIIGTSGCGKSTLARLIAKRISADSIFIDTLNINDIDNISYIKNVLYVNEDGHLFNNTVYQNLNVNKNKSNHDIENTLKMVGLGNKFSLETIIEANYSNISGGEKQRLILARAILMDASVYIFDEITSNVDTKTEKDILAIINELSKTKLIIFITHNLLNVLNSKKIVYMESGKVVDFLVHDELMNINKEYSQMFNHQKAISQIHSEETYE